MSNKQSPMYERFWPKVAAGASDECWPWLKSLTRGYGHFAYREKGRSRSTQAHRMAYTLAVGPIPDGMTIDHLCHDPATCAGGLDCPHRRCCNPAHLRPVTHRENILRGDTLAARNAAKTHCPKGHPFDKENTRFYPNGGRICRICAAAKSHLYRLSLANSKLQDYAATQVTQ